MYGGPFYRGPFYRGPFYRYGPFYHMLQKWVDHFTMDLFTVDVFTVDLFTVDLFTYIRGNGRARRFLVTTVTETSNADADACVETRLDTNPNWPY